ncbi:MAG: hypothetical protein GFH27_549303n280 [Chloroflexi bacterium AL-W]|nr:hypothetical protein [Chloroflexi bacterium AL-N1]NOK68165.1 hypothetical protein [Chloroflexi bacterium AL-N10]NOK73505.1 hypothetical protein [Chloroflexi bacterium AL-N5]NOK83419.1 hypothetical protein [Chloroflexi bacterium AL-W]NOK87836.1 hypothetical protein [Chloroflexi bacterium AL-N15]
MTSRFSRPRLIDESDRQYRAFVAQIMLSKDNHRAIRAPRARDLFGGEVEEALRSWLSQSYLLSERRIVEYLEHRGRSAITKYRELDAVVFEDPKRIHVFEIKASQKATSLRRAIRQLHDTREILNRLFARVYTTILLVDTGIPTAEEVATLMRAPEAPPEPPATLAEVLTQLPQIQLIESLEQRNPDSEVVNLLCFSVDDIIKLVGAEQLHLDWDAEDEQEPLPPEAQQTYYYSTESAGEATADNPMAEALKRALADHQDPPLS